MLSMLHNDDDDDDGFVCMSVCVCVCMDGHNHIFLLRALKKVKVLVFSPFHRVCFIYFISFQLFYSLKCVPCLCVFVFDRS